MSDKQPLLFPSAFAVLADAAAMLGAILFGPWLVARFSYQFVQNLEFTAIENALIMAALYVLFLIGVWQLRKIEFDETNALPDRLLQVAAVLFAAVFAFVFADLSGFIDSMRFVNFGEMGNATYMLFTAGIFVFFPLTYLLTLVTPVEKTISPTPSTRHILALALTNFLFVGFIAYLIALIERGRLQLPFSALNLLIVASAILLFSIPRLHYLHDRANRIVGFCLFVLLFTGIGSVMLRG